MQPMGMMGSGRTLARRNGMCICWIDVCMSWLGLRQMAETLDETLDLEAIFVKPE
jgi:hypothetical protein